MRKSLIFAVLAFAVFGAAFMAQAQATSTTATTTATTTVATTTVATTTATTTSTSSTNALDGFLAQIQALRTKIIEGIIVKIQNGTATKADIKNLQRILAYDRLVYPEGAVTGNYGPLTQRALLKYQAKYGFSTTTNFRPLKLLQEGAGNSGKVPAGLMTAPGIQVKIATTTASTTVTKNLPGKLIKKIGNWFSKKPAPTTTAATSTEN